MDLTALGLRLQAIDEVEHGGAVALFTDEMERTARVWVYRFELSEQARQVDREWERKHRVQFQALGIQNAKKWRSLSHLYYKWRSDNWFVAIEVPDSMPEPAKLRDAIRDSLFEHFQR